MNVGLGRGSLGAPAGPGDRKSTEVSWTGPRHLMAGRNLGMVDLLLHMNRISNVHNQQCRGCGPAGPSPNTSF